MSALRLPDTDLLHGLNDEARRTLLAAAVVREFAPGSVLWREGEPSRGLAVLEAGTVRIVKVRGGRQFVVHTEGPGSTLGEIPVFDGADYPATAVASSRCKCVFLPPDAVLNAVAADPRFAQRLLARLSRRVRGLVMRLGAATTGTVRSRLAAHLLARSALAGGGPFRIDGTQAALAEELGTVREVVAREMSKLRSSGVLASAGRGRYRIMDESRLEAVART